MSTLRPGHQLMSTLRPETPLSRTPVDANVETRDSNVQDTSARPCCVWCPTTHSQCPVTGPWLQVISCWRSVIRDTRVQTRDNIHVSSHVTWTQYKVRVIEDSRVPGLYVSTHVNYSIRRKTLSLYHLRLRFHEPSTWLILPTEILLGE